MKPRALNVKMTYAEFEEICDGLDNGQLEDAIGTFIRNHKEQKLFRDDVLSLTLYKAVIYGESDTVEKILSTPHSGSILTAMIGAYDSVIRKVFGQERTSSMIRETDGSVFGAVLEYLKHNRDIPLVDLEGKEFVGMYNMVKLPRWDVTTDDGWWYIRKYFLDALYTKESLDKLDESLWRKFDSVQYLKDYDEQQKQEMLKLGDKKKDDVGEDGDTDENKSDEEQKVQTVARDNKAIIKGEGASDSIGEEVVSQECYRDRIVDSNEDSRDVILEVFQSLMSWIEELPLWLQEHVMKRHSVVRILEYMKSCNKGMTFRLGEKEGEEQLEESMGIETWEAARVEQVLSHQVNSEFIYGGVDSYEMPLLMSGAMNILYSHKMCVEEMYEGIEEYAMGVEDVLWY
ncbi:hypothetical protein EDM53_02380 [Rickettsiales endosymbiont of Peranema trichophorum]|uniref:hypothetical protein n=1 Tax=Rickettsiales endosymbiont of Peranema trichophorum TaxID=2486577 RepID=UPI001023DD91|nr:hypothetical protein [Rickettsiales endosymbiont of Peranema trichophorum]RZI47352.1 hypothetical protein EDM53_02380 [Rickettsiales endosymbiont of Peranema trichophorum]